MRLSLIFIKIILIISVLPNVSLADVIWGKDIPLTVDDNRESTIPSIITDDQGRLHVIWVDNRDDGYEIYYKRSWDQGRTWEPDARVTINGWAGYRPSIAADSQGRLHLVWPYGNGDEVYYKRSSDGGTTWEPDVPLTDNGEWCSHSSIAADIQGRIHVVWEDSRESGTPETYYKRSTDGGTTWETEFRLTKNSFFSMSPSIAADAQGGVHVVWNDFRDGNNEIYYKQSKDGGTTWGSDVQLTEDSFSSLLPSIATDALGGVHVVWNDFRDGNDEIYYKRSRDGGITWDSDVRLTINEFYSSYPSIIVDSQGRLHVTWEDSRDGNEEIYYKRSRDGGTTWGSDVRLTTAHPSFSLYPSIAADTQGKLYVVWYDNRDGN